MDYYFFAGLQGWWLRGVMGVFFCFSFLLWSF